MIKRPAGIALLALIPLSAVAVRKLKETVTLRVVRSNTRIHRSSPHNIFSYTELIFAQGNGNRIVYPYVLRGDICPTVESGQT
ncbi:MAG TPA: hypothetical protein VGP19_12205 [Candidatus Acidoferrales bacterium]|nr:hypothetical protein [Candidatus Acidoferrales bacterium]